MSDPTNPNAQGLQPGDPVSPDQQSGQSSELSQQQLTGLQKRFDEFAAKVGEKERENQSLRDQLMQATLALAQGQRPQAPAEPQVEVDPDLRRAIDAAVAPLKAQLAQQSAQAMGMTADMQFNMSIANELPVVKQRAAAIWNQVKANGDHMRGFHPQQAIDLARGQSITEIVAAASAQIQHQQGLQFNQQPGAAPITQQQVTRPTQQVQQLGPEPDYEDDPDAASAYLAKKLAGKSF